jgi:hypothetical protein
LASLELRNGNCSRRLPVWRIKIRPCAEHRRQAPSRFALGTLGRQSQTTEAWNSGKVPLGVSGIQIRFEMDLIIEGIRPGRVVRVRPASWPQEDVRREEFLGDGSYSHDDRFPTPPIFPEY